MLYRSLRKINNNEKKSGLSSSFFFSYVLLVCEFFFFISLLLFLLLFLLGRLPPFFIFDFVTFVHLNNGLFLWFLTHTDTHTYIHISSIYQRAVVYAERWAISIPVAGTTPAVLRGIPSTTASTATPMSRCRTAARLPPTHPTLHNDVAHSSSSMDHLPAYRDH